MLRDMEELVSKLKDDDIREYMAEAMRCYSVGSFRACIVLSVITGMYDLHNKIKDLAPSIKAARELDEEIQMRINRQDVYEKYMVEQAATEKLGVLTPSERETIVSYMSTRNRCAHPGGHFSSAEEARAIFCGIIDTILSKPSLLGVPYKNVIIEQIKDEHFFPTDESIVSISNEIYNKMHKTAILPLCRDLVKIIESRLETTRRINAAKMIAGLMANFDDGQKEKIKDIISSLLDDATFQEFIIMVTCNPRILLIISQNDRLKFVSKITFDIETKDINLYNAQIWSLLKVGVLAESEREKIISTINENICDFDASFLHNLVYEKIITQQEKEYIEESVHSIISSYSVNRESDVTRFMSSWMEKVDILNLVDVDDRFFLKLLDMVKSSDFYVCNKALSYLVSMNRSLASRMPREMQVKFVKSILRAAGGNAFEAIDIVSRGFSNLENYIDPFVHDLLRNKEKINETIEEIWYTYRFVEFMVKTENVPALRMIVHFLLGGEIIVPKRVISELYLGIERYGVENFDTELQGLKELYDKK